ncbi:MAG: hypothetical protein GY946_33355 [bacterium]|nr:hypothetical protein [bacterium]
MSGSATLPPAVHGTRTTARDHNRVLATPVLATFRKAVQEQPPDFGKTDHPAESRGTGPNRERKADEAWNAISRNLDGLMAFFDALMTRARIPLIDYDRTFPSTKFREYLKEIVFEIHPAPEVYEQVKSEAMAKVRGLDFASLPPTMLQDLHAEMGAFGYEWFPDVGIDAPYLDRIAAGFVLGGIIFGGYAQATGTQHLLQTKRSRFFAQLSVPRDQAPLWGFKMEKQLFKRLTEYASTDPGLRLETIRTPPTVLPHLIHQGKPPTSTTEILDRAVALRESSDGKKYRAWYQRMRARWELGDHDDVAEAEVDKLVAELDNRIGRSQGWATQVDLKIEADIGLAKVEATAKDVRLRVPNKIRNWIVDVLPFRGYRKLLLRIVLDQRGYENLTMGLKKLWDAT